LRRLADVVQKTETRDPRKTPDDLFQYVDIACVDNQRGVIKEARTLRGAEAPHRARKVIRRDDVIVATTRPYLNQVALVPAELDGQICSTGFCVLRSNGEVDPRFLYWFTRSRRFID
jgi:type I restriction enzyme S subunit